DYFCGSWDNSANHVF
nr:immunoglobulin light chain junction region [Macaca mulatta]